MNTEGPAGGHYPPRSHLRALAMVAVGVGVGLLAFGAPAGLPPLGGSGAFWAVLTILCIVFGVLGFTDGVDPRGRGEREPTASQAPPRADPPATGGIETKLRELLRLREGKLISEDEYQR